MIHLSSKLAWHENGWDGCVCQFPHLNASCFTNETIRDERDAEREREHTKIHITDLDGWKQKRRWYQERIGILVIGDSAEGVDIEPGTFPIVITSRDGENGSIDVPKIEQLIRKYILLED